MGDKLGDKNRGRLAKWFHVFTDLFGLLFLLFTEDIHVESLSAYWEIRRTVLAVLMIQLELKQSFTRQLSMVQLQLNTLRPRNKERTSGVGSPFGGSVDKRQQGSHSSQGWRAGFDFGAH